ncbi:MAG: metallophosphoesterase family protein [Candidatus Nanohaloarchaea archaeon]|nr:metallophosphoesterase family protein [Candidatus Nanohaloarchaea archaeon]
MNLAVISDIHSNIEALNEVLKDLEGRELEGYICAGDLVGYYFHPNEVVETIRELDAVCVKGNHDNSAVQDVSPMRMNSMAGQAIRWNKNHLSDENQEFLEGLPLRREERLGGKKVFLAHGSPVSPLKEYVKPRYVDESFLDRCFHNDWPDILIMGHTHIPFEKKIGNTLVMNPGSVGQPRDGDPRASYAVLDTEEMSAEIMRRDYNLDKVAQEVKDEGLPDMLGERLREGR